MQRDDQRAREALQLSQRGLLEGHIEVGARVGPRAPSWNTLTPPSMSSCTRSVQFPAGPGGAAPPKRRRRAPAAAAAAQQLTPPAAPAAPGLETQPTPQHHTTTRLHTTTTITQSITSQFHLPPRSSDRPSSIRLIHCRGDGGHAAPPAAHAEDDPDDAQPEADEAERASACRRETRRHTGTEGVGTARRAHGDRRRVCRPPLRRHTALSRRRH